MNWHIDRNIIVRDSEEKPIAILYGTRNAALIVSAHELLETLEMVLEEYVFLIESGDCGGRDVDATEYESVSKANAVIVKAKGEQ